MKHIYKLPYFLNIVFYILLKPQEVIFFFLRSNLLIEIQLVLKGYQVLLTSSILKFLCGTTPRKLLYTTLHHKFCFIIPMDHFCLLFSFPFYLSNHSKFFVVLFFTTELVLTKNSWEIKLYYIHCFTQVDVKNIWYPVE